MAAKQGTHLPARPQPRLPLPAWRCGLDHSQRWRPGDVAKVIIQAVEKTQAAAK